MHFSNLEGVEAAFALETIIVKLMEGSQSRKLRAWYFGQRMKVESRKKDIRDEGQQHQAQREEQRHCEQQKRPLLCLFDVT
jgi:RecJ-like exonuclease